MSTRFIVAAAVSILAGVQTAQGQASAPSGQIPPNVAFARTLVMAPDDAARDALLSAHPEYRIAGFPADLVQTVQSARQVPTAVRRSVISYAIHLAATLHDDDSEALAELNLGTIDADEDKYDIALEHFTRAHDIATATGNTKRLAQAISDSGVVQRRRGDVDVAQACFQTGLDLFTKINNDEGIAAALNNLGNIQTDRGNLRVALDFYARSSAIREHEPAQVAQLASSYLNIGGVYAHQGDFDLAFDYYQRALKALDAVPNDLQRSATYSNMGQAATQVGRYDDAITYLNQALTIAQAIKNRRQEGTTLYNIAVNQVKLGHPDEGLATFQRALAIHQEVGDRLLMIDDLTGISTALLEGKRFETDRAIEARDPATRAVALAKEAGNLERIRAAETRLGDVDFRLGDTARAEAEYRDAIDIVEQLEQLVAGGAQQQQTSFANREDPFRSLITLLAASGRAEEGLLVAEHTRARTLLQILERGEPMASPAMSTEEATRERQLRLAVVLASTQLSNARNNSKPGDPRVASLAAALGAAHRAQDDFHAQLDATHPEFRAQRGEITTIEARDFPLLVPTPASAVVEFVANTSATYAFILRRNPAGSAVPVRLTMHRLPIGHDALQKQTGDFRRRIAARDLNIRSAARDMYDAILAPLEGDLAGATDWEIVPDGGLWDVPFQALLEPSGHYVVERAAVTLVPSLSALREMQAADQHRAVSRNAIEALVLGSDEPSPTLAAAPLVEAIDQAKAIGQIYGAHARVVTGVDATKQALAADSRRVPVIHIAAHGVLDDASPLHSYVSLSRRPSDPPDAGTLDASELMQMKFDADLIVLSGCETGRGRLEGGEGLIGLSWALFAAGTPSAVLSQWKVDADSTTLLMTEFHRAIGRGIAASGRVQGRARALQQAAIKLLKGGTYAHPFYWAPFVVMGNGQ